MLAFIFQSTVLAKGGMLLHGTVHVRLDTAAAVLSASKVRQTINKCATNFDIFQDIFRKINIADLEG